MSDDIVKRLRDDYVRQDITSWNLLPEAADEIERLQAEFERLERQLAEVDGMLVTHAYRIDSNHPNLWPKGSILTAATRRHAARLRAEG